MAAVFSMSHLKVRRKQSKKPFFSQLFASNTPSLPTGLPLVSSWKPKTQKDWKINHFQLSLINFHIKKDPFQLTLIYQEEVKL